MSLRIQAQKRGLAPSFVLVCYLMIFMQFNKQKELLVVPYPHHFKNTLCKKLLKNFVCESVNMLNATQIKENASR